MKKEMKISDKHKYNMEVSRERYLKNHWKEFELKYKDKLYDLRINKKNSYGECKRIMNLDVGVVTIRKWCEKWGFKIDVPRKGMPGYNKPSRLSQHVTEELLRIYYEKLLLKWDEIPKIFGVGRHAILNKRKQYGIKVRSKKGMTIRRIKDYRGENNPAWNPNREQVVAPYTVIFYDKSYREMIIRQQNCSCPICNKKINMSAHLHHIDFDKENDDRYNLIFLDDSCHGKCTDVIEDIEKIQDINNKVCVSIIAA